MQIDGSHLVFTDLPAFHEAMQEVMKTSDEDLIALTERIGFHSQYNAYVSILNRADASDAAYEDVFMNGEHKRFSVSEDGELIPPMSLRSYSALLNPDGEVIINDHLHYFSDDVQVVVVDRSRAKLASALERRTSTEDVIYNPQDEPIVSDPATLNKSNVVNCSSGLVTLISDEHTNNNRRLKLTLVSRLDVDFISSSSSLYTFTLNGKVENRKKRGLKGYRYHDFDSQMEIPERLVFPTRLQRNVNGVLQTTLAVTLTRNAGLFVPTDQNGNQVVVSNWEENFLLRTVLGPSQNNGWTGVRAIASGSLLKAETYTDTGTLFGEVGCN